MPKIVLSLIVWLVSTHALAAPASTESIERLMKATRTEALLDSMYGAMEQVMRGSVQHAIAGKPVSPEQQRALDALPAKLMVVVREEFNWQTMRPLYVQLYLETFSQEEIDGLLAFYESSTGQAFVSKMPVVLQKSVAISQAQMQRLVPKLNEAVAQAVREAKIPN